MSLLTLPTEVFYRILDFVDFRDIIEGLRSTCRRFHALVENYDRLKVDFTKVRTTSRFKSLLRLIRPENVRSWIMNLDEDVNEYYMDDLSRFFTFDSRLRSVVIVQTDDDSHWEPEIFVLLQGIVNMPNLHQLTLDIFPRSLGLITWPEYSKIERLKLGRCSYAIAQNIFDRLVHLEDFHMSHPMYDRIDRTIRPNSSRSLTSLTLNHCNFSIGDLHYFLSQHGNLRSFRLYSIRRVNKPADEYFRRWENFIRSNLPNLKHFDLRVCSSPSVWRSIESVLQPLTSSFWLEEKRWFFNARYEEDIVVSSWTSGRELFPVHLEPNKISYSVTTQRANDRKRRRSMWTARVNLSMIFNAIVLERILKQRSSVENRTYSSAIQFHIPDPFYFRHVTQLVLDVPVKLELSSEDFQRFSEWIDLSNVRHLRIFDSSLKTLQTTSFIHLLEKTSRLETFGFYYNNYEKRIIELAPIINRRVEHLIILKASLRCVQKTIQVIKHVPMITFEEVSGRDAIIKYLKKKSHRFYCSDQSRSIEFHPNRKRKRNDD